MDAMPVKVESSACFTDAKSVQILEINGLKLFALRHITTLHRLEPMVTEDG